MSPIAHLAIVLAALFYVEGVRWVPVHAVAFARRPWGGYAARVPFVLRRGAPKGLLLAAPWAPALERFLTSETPAPGNRFDARRVRNRLRRLRPFLTSFTRLSWLLSLNMFVAGPLLAHYLGWARVLFPWLGVQAVLTALVLRACVLAARHLPRLASEVRVEALISFALYPPSAARFLEATFANTFADVDPLTTAAVLLDRGALASMARARLVAEALDAEERGEIEALLDREGLGLDEVLAAPSREGDSHGFCPRCRAQYRAGVDRCADCRGVALVLFH